MNSLQTTGPKPQPTKTEMLLRNAMNICVSVTNNVEPSESLLCAVFESLQQEHVDGYEPAMGEVH